MASEPSTEDAAGGGVVLAIAEGGSDVMNRNIGSLDSDLECQPDK